MHFEMQSASTNSSPSPVGLRPDAFISYDLEERGVEVYLQMCRWEGQHVFKIREYGKYLPLSSSLDKIKRLSPVSMNGVIDSRRNETHYLTQNQGVDGRWESVCNPTSPSKRTTQKCLIPRTIEG